MRIVKNGATISSVDAWFAISPPKRAYQWKDSRSAKELAKAFCRSGTVEVPAELAALLASRVELGHVQVDELWPEHKISLDSFRGETRNADLAGIGTCALGATAITIEAKAYESFGELISEVLAGASERSNRPARVDALSRSIFGVSGVELGTLRYQLLHGVGATLILAEQHKAPVAVFIVYEFQQATPTERNHRNARDLEAFVARLGPSQPLIPETLLGPFNMLHDERSSNVQLYIGKAIRRL